MTGVNTECRSDNSRITQRGRDFEFREQTVLVNSWRSISEFLKRTKDEVVRKMGNDETRRKSTI